MKRFTLYLMPVFAATILMACQPAQSEKSADIADEEKADMAIKADAVRLRLKPPVSEPLACIFPIQIENGLADRTSVTMIAFKLTGPGNDANGNMFAPAADPNALVEARVIVEGQSCEAYDTLSIPEIRCTSGEDNCASKVELIDGGGLRFAKSF